MPLEKLSRERIVEALNLLGRFAAEAGVQLEVCIYGGSAMLLAYARVVIESLLSSAPLDQP